MIIRKKVDYPKNNNNKALDLRTLRMILAIFGSRINIWFLSLRKNIQYFVRHTKSLFWSVHSNIIGKQKAVLQKCEILVKPGLFNYSKDQYNVIPWHRFSIRTVFNVWEVHLQTGSWRNIKMHFDIHPYSIWRSIFVPYPSRRALFTCCL